MLSRYAVDFLYSVNCLVFIIPNCDITRLFIAVIVLFAVNFFASSGSRLK